MKKLILLFILIFTTFAQLATAQEVDSTIIKVSDAVKLALVENGVDGKFKININGFESGFKLKNESDSYQVYVNDIKLDQKSHHFKANIAFINQNNQAEKFRINGSYDQLISVPVLSQKMPNNTTIKESDIAWIDMPKEQVTFDTIIQPEKIIGQALKRSMPDSTPLKERDLQKAQILLRNTTVSILYTTPTISLKTTGIALDNGGEGDIIRVRNTTSNKIIQAVIQDESTVAALHQNNNLVNKTASIEDTNYVR